MELLLARQENGPDVMFKRGLVPLSTFKVTHQILKLNLNLYKVTVTT